MKSSYIPMLMAGIFMPSFINGSSTTSLEDTWNLEEPAFNYTNKQFLLTYKFSTFITSEDQTLASLYFYKDDLPDGPRNCKSETSANEYTTNVGLTLDENSLIETSDPSSYRDGKKETVAITLNTGVIDQDPDVFKAGDGTSSIKFCVRFGLCTGDCKDTDTSYEVNFLESLVELTVDLRGEFTVEGIDVAPKSKLKRTANQEYGLEAFQCKGKDAAGGTRYGQTEDDATPTFNQGDVITVCVQPDSTAIGDNIFMKEVERFEYVLLDPVESGGGESTIKQLAIDKDQAIEGTNPFGEMYGLTEIDDCRGEVACVIKTILFATFYTRVGVVTGSGSATMQFGTTGSDGNTDVTRKLRGAERHLQAGDEDVAGAGEFDVNFQINSNDAFQSASGASSSMSILALVGSAAAALML